MLFLFPNDFFSGSKGNVAYMLWNFLKKGLTKMRIFEEQYFLKYPTNGGEPYFVFDGKKKRNH